MSSSSFSPETLAFMIETEADLQKQRSLSLEERGRILGAVCRAAARLERSRLANGFPPSQPVPWPESTWEFLRRSMSDG